MAPEPGVVRVLAVSDEIDAAAWHEPTIVGPVDLIVACGDLPFGYLERLMAGLDAPLVFVPGNHDPDISGYRTSRGGLTLRAAIPTDAPWPPGAINADGRVVDVAGLRVAGIGGCVRYSSGPNQYSPRQQARRARRLARAANRRRRHDRRSVDLILSHAPPAGIGEGGRIGDPTDRAHQGFTALVDLVDRLEPAMLLHGHVPPARWEETVRRLGRTEVRNVTGRHTLSIVAGAGSPAAVGHRGP